METGAEFGGALGMAVLGSIGTAVYRHEMPGSAPDVARETLGGALAVADRFPGLATTAREAFTSGMQGAAIAGAVLLLGAAVLAAVTLRGVEVRKEAQEPEPEESLV
jgi:DHA2 family multidrug resistance protein-like MFS transporter